MPEAISYTTNCIKYSSIWNSLVLIEHAKVETVKFISVHVFVFRSNDDQVKVADQVILVLYRKRKNLNKNQKKAPFQLKILMAF